MFGFFIFVVLTQFHKSLCARSVHSDKGTLWNQFILTFCNHFAHKLTAEPSFLSVEPRPINQPDIWHKAAHCWWRRWWGRGTMQWIHSCEQHVSDQTERKALFKFFFSLSLFPWSFTVSRSYLNIWHWQLSKHWGRGKNNYAQWS